MMSKTTMIFLALILPLVALGQNRTNEGTSATNLERQIKTTLLNDVKKNEVTLNVNINKSYSLTVANVNTEIINPNDLFEYNTDKIQKGIRSLKSNKHHFSDPLKIKGLFEN